MLRNAVPFVVTFCLFSARGLAQTVDDGRFGRALALHKTTAHAPTNPIYTVVPITVECWAKLSDKSGHAVLVANEFKSSGTHWEIFAEKETGKFCAFLPQWKPDQVKSDADIVDGKWHHLAMTFDGHAVVLFVDGKEVKRQWVEKIFKYPDSSPLTIGHVNEIAGPKDGFIDEVRISRTVRAIEKAPDAPFKADGDTIALWHFDEAADATSFADASRTNNPVRLGDKEQKSPMAGQDNRWQEMEFGPFFSATFPASYPGKQNVTNKGVAVRLGKDKNAAVVFDTELLRPAVAWTGEFIKLTPVREGLAGPPEIAGKPVWGTLALPGWSASAEFADTRPEKLGPLPKEMGHYQGLYLQGDRAVFAYTVAGTRILESYDVEANNEARAFTRTVELASVPSPLTLRLLDLPGAKGAVHMPLEANAFGAAVLEKDGLATAAAIVAPPREASWDVSDGRIVLKLPASAQPVRFKALLWSGPSADVAAINTLYAHSAAPQDLSALTRGGPPRYPVALTTKGVLGRNDQPYTVDTLTAPEDNPWKSFLRFGGHDFFSNGDLAICSISGDVWVVSGIDDKLEKLSWRRFATGLFQPLGLRIVDDKVYVLGRDQITRLHDLNGDGEADFYENFNNDGYVTTNGHAYVTNLDTDPEGNFYYTKCGDSTAHGGTLLKVSKDGGKLEVFATGLRNPNGMGVSPKGEVFEADNQGEWVPATRLDLATKGSFLGFQPMSKRNPPPTEPGKPLCWMPQNVDNSAGGECWATSDKWGPLNGAMLHTSYGAAALLLVLPETVNGQAQGGVWRFPLKFDTGIMRGRFSPKDGQLYVSGLRGWQTTGARSGALQRVRYTGKPVYIPAELHVHKNGVRLSFTSALDAQAATDKDSYEVLQWNYKWTSSYGSRQWSANDPEKQGYDEVEVKSATLLGDGKTVFLELPEIKPVMQMQISYKLKAADGKQVKGEVYNTIHELAPAFAAAAAPAAAKEEAKAVKIVLIAGKKSHGPGEHEYEKSLKLLAAALESSTNVKNVKPVVILEGWPEDEAVLDGAASIVLFSDGSDRDEKAHPLLHGERLKKLGALMDKGVGLVCLHYTVFVPTKQAGDQFRDWIGGYFDYDSNGNERAKWYSKLGMNTFTASPLSDHPTLRGVKEFTTKTEYYWNIRFREDDKRLTPLLGIDPKAKASEGVVAWAVERKDGGRGVGFTGGHYFADFKLDPFRKFVLNSILWTARADVPEAGVESTVSKE